MIRHVCYADACPQTGKSQSTGHDCASRRSFAQVEELLRKGPPAYLRELTDKLEAKGASTLERLQNWPLSESVQTS